MNEIRLLKVARALREASGPGFTMDYWHRCGTPACAFGHYVGRKDLQDSFSFFGDLSIADENGRLMDLPFAIIAHFDITMREYLELFSYYGCDFAETRAEAADYIERFVERHREIKPVNSVGSVESLDRDTISHVGSISSSPVLA